MVGFDHETKLDRGSHARPCPSCRPCCDSSHEHFTMGSSREASNPSLTIRPRDLAIVPLLQGSGLTSKGSSPCPERSGLARTCQSRASQPYAATSNTSLERARAVASSSTGVWCLLQLCLRHARHPCNSWRRKKHCAQNEDAVKVTGQGTLPKPSRRRSQQDASQHSPAQPCSKFSSK